MEVFGWIFITVLVPTGAPVFLNFLLLKFLPAHALGTPPPTWLAPIKDGQLFWTSLALATSALYELPKDFPLYGLMEGLLVILCILASLMAALGGVFPAKIEDPNQTWTRRYGLCFWSMIETIFTGVLFFVVHFHKQNPLCGN